MKIRVRYRYINDREGLFTPLMYLPIQETVIDFDPYSITIEHAIRESMGLVGGIITDIESRFESSGQPVEAIEDRPPAESKSGAGTSHNKTAARNSEKIDMVEFATSCVLGPKK